MDPFKGACGNPTSLWVIPEDYDTSVGTFESGIILQNDLKINDLRERNTTLNRPFAIAPSSDSSLNFWSHLYGLRAGKELSLTWYTPDNIEWFNYTFTLDQDYWYYYYWSFINHQDLTEGTWNVLLDYDGTEVASETFLVTKTANVSKLARQNNCKAYSSQRLLELKNDQSINLRVTNALGKEVEINAITKGVYFIQIVNQDNHCTLKRYVH